MGMREISIFLLWSCLGNLWRNCLGNVEGNFRFRLFFILGYRLLVGFRQCIRKVFFIETLKLTTLWQEGMIKGTWFILLILDWLKDILIQKLDYIYLLNKESPQLGLQDIQVLHRMMENNKAEKTICNPQDFFCYISPKENFHGKASR